MIGLEEEKELNEIVEDSNSKIQCFLCEKIFNNAFAMDEHLQVAHQLNQENLSIYLKSSKNSKRISQGKIKLFRSNVSNNEL